MRRIHFVSAIAGAVIGAALTAAAVAWAQPQPPAAGEALARKSAVPPASVESLSPDTFVSVKDHGSSQTVIVYKVDDKGMARLTHKAKFFY